MFTITSVFSSANYELNLYEKVIPAIFKQNNLKIYVDEDAKEILKYSKIFTIVENCDNALLLIGDSFPNMTKGCLKKPVFSSSYESFMINKNSFGAFYWRKSRPQIKFKSKVIHRYNLTLPKSLKRFSK